jgi:hypothetical protein
MFLCCLTVFMLFKWPHMSVCDTSVSVTNPGTMICYVLFYFLYMI